MRDWLLRFGGSFRVPTMRYVCLGFKNDNLSCLVRQLLFQNIFGKNLSDVEKPFVGFALLEVWDYKGKEGGWGKRSRVLCTGTILWTPCRAIRGFLNRMSCRLSGGQDVSLRSLLYSIFLANTGKSFSDLVLQISSAYLVRERPTRVEFSDLNTGRSEDYLSIFFTRLKIQVC